MSAPQLNPFATRLLGWFDLHGRHDLPWQHPRHAYRVWLAEVMLQQTQVKTVIPYFERFVAALPTLAELAAAPQDRVLALWSGLGYYTRARNLQRSAQLCVEQHGGELPRDFAALCALPGIGRSTAGAILAQAHGQPHPILDGNVRRVLARYHGIHDWPGASATQRVLWEHAQNHTPPRRCADYTQAVMDLGATVCTRSKPRCTLCPLADDCIARRDGLTAVLPTSRPGKQTPTRATTMLIARDRAGRILLWRRPPTGVWAHLWSLPEADSIQSGSALLRVTVGIEPGRGRTMPPLLHTFSHFRLAISPVLFDNARIDPRQVAEHPDAGWFDAAQIAELGLPAPVRKLLQSLQEESET